MNKDKNGMEIIIDKGLLEYHSDNVKITKILSEMKQLKNKVNIIHRELKGLRKDLEREKILRREGLRF